jgi:hypothetical protein
MTYIYIYIYIYIYRTAPLTSRRFILYIYSTSIRTEYFKHAAHSPIFSLQNAIWFIMLPFLVPVLFTYYIQGVLKLKKNSGAKGHNRTKLNKSYYLLAFYITPFNMCLIYCSTENLCIFCTWFIWVLHTIDYSQTDYFLFTITGRLLLKNLGVLSAS